MKKTYGWIIQWDDIGDDIGFVNQDGDEYTDCLRDALVFDTRAKARKNSKEVGDSDETVHKVELFKNGKAKKIIPGR